jgi:uncharacterized RDD family membrane protein YckC
MTFDPMQVTLASRSTRLYGQLIDGAVGVSPVIAGVILSNFSDALAAVFVIGGFVFSFLYYLFADGLHGGQSFAKRWLGMQVVHAGTGAPCTFGQSFIRNLLLAVLGPLDWIFIFGERHQRLGDHAANTIVIAD